MKLFRPLTLSLLVLIAVYILSRYVSYIPTNKLVVFLPLLPYVVSSIIVILALSFHRSRIAQLVLLLAFFYWLLQTYPAAKWFRDFLPLLAILLPINILLFAFYKERGAWTLSSVIRLGGVGLQGLVVIVLLTQQPVGGYALLQQVWVKMLVFTSSPHGQLSQLIILITILLSYVLAVKKESWLESGIVAVLVLLTMIFHSGATGTENLIYISMMPLILGVVILFDSYRMAYLDELTSLPGRRALQENLARLTGDYTLAMLDIDHFKKFNDTYGHDIGDQVLRFVAGKMRKVGGGGKAYRYGGEEFTFIFAGKGIDEALPHLEAVRMDIAESKFAIRGKG
ncbi:MAG: GGDEF domain-containing protein, partial [Gammaproteobacteria bacterium]|nr:GGDEF domain-containing protein [Gammaproteobacteria bacterium]